MAGSGTSLRSVNSLTWADLDKRKYYTVGPCVFLCVRFITHPLQLLKTQVQMQTGVRHTLRESFLHIVRSDGVKGFYSGFSVSSVTILTSQVYITLFEFGRSEAVWGPGRPEALRNFFAGAVAVLTSQLLGNPVDVVANRIMASGGKGSTGHLEYRNAGLFNGGALRALRHLFSTQGMKGFYHGYGPSVALNAPSSAFWWALYAITRPRAMALIPPNTAHTHAFQRLAEICCGVVSGTATAILLNPLDVIRTRVQVTGTSVSEVIKSTLKKDGMKGFAKGMHLRVMLLGGNGAILISAYELVKRLSARTREDASQQNDT